MGLENTQNLLRAILRHTFVSASFWIERHVLFAESDVITAPPTVQKSCLHHSNNSAKDPWGCPWCIRLIDDRFWNAYSTRFNSQSAGSFLVERLESAHKNAACVFCNARISYGQSACSDCMKKYNIRPFDLGTDGCGCDK